MEVLYAAWHKGKTTEDALQSAQLAVLSQEKTRHPFYWAAFVTVQGPR